MAFTELTDKAMAQIQEVVADHCRKAYQRGIDSGIEKLEIVADTDPGSDLGQFARLAVMELDKRKGLVKQVDHHVGNKDSYQAGLHEGIDAIAEITAEMTLVQIGFLDVEDVQVLARRKIIELKKKNGVFA